MTLKGDFEQRRTGCGETENKAACSECGNTDHFKAECAGWKSQKKSRPATNPTPNPAPQTKGGKKIGRKEKGTGGAKAVMFYCLEMNECVPVIEEIPENEVNVATMQIILANAPGVGDWGRGNCTEDCSIIIDTGFNGGGLRRYPVLRRYVEYVRSFPHMDNLVETREKIVEICVCESSGADV